MNLFEIKKQYEEGAIPKKEYIDRMHERHSVLFEYADYLRAVNTGIQRIEISEGQVIITTNTNDIKMICDPCDKRIVPIEMLNFGPYEEDVYKIIWKIIGSDSVIFDIGANYGWYSLIFSKIFPHAQVFAFEPIPHTYNYLKKHIELNKIQNVSAFNFGFSDSIDEKTFYWTEKESGSASMKNIQKRSHINKVTCKVTTIDHFMKNRRISIDLIKCDVEGAELFVYKGAVETLKKYKPIIFSEMLRKWSKKFGYHPDDIINLLSEIGYHCYGYIDSKIEKINSVSPELKTTNFFFFHKEKHKRTIKRFR